MHSCLPSEKSDYIQDTPKVLYNTDSIYIQESVFKNDRNIWIGSRWSDHLNIYTGYVKNLQQAIENVLEIQTIRLKKGNNKLIPDIMRLTGWLERVKVNPKAKYNSI